MIGRDGLRQSEVKQQRVCEAKAGGKQEGHPHAPAAQYAADGWPKNKTQTKGCANQAHSFRAIFFGGDVGDISLRRRDVSASDAVKDASHKKHPERGCKTENLESRCRCR